MILGRLVASGKPVEVTRYAGTVGQGIMLQLTAETGYVQVQLAELLRMLLNPVGHQGRAGIIDVMSESIDRDGICLPCREGFCVHLICKQRGCGCTKVDAGG